MSREAILKRLGGTESIDEEIGPDGFTLATTLETNTPGPEDVFLAKERKRLLQMAICTFSIGHHPKIKEVVVSRFGLNGEDPETLSSIGKKNGLSRERIRQLEKEGVGLLLQNKYFQEFLRTF